MTVRNIRAICADTVAAVGSGQRSGPRATTVTQQG